VHETFRRQVFPRTLPALEQRRRPRRLLGWLLAPALAAAALGLYVTHHLAEPEIALKGGPTLTVSLTVFARRGNQVFQVAEGTPLHAGDQLRFRLIGSGDLPFVLVGSVDGAGKPSIYYPFGGDKSAHIQGPAADLPGSVVLDTAPGPERLFVFLSRSALHAADVLPALRNVGSAGPGAIRHTLRLPIRGVAAQLTLLFEKANP
jgi:hypothetical protein